MPSRGASEQGSEKELSKRQQRAERILDAARELLRRWGYKKTTLDDISKQAGVGKGTIYLHWKTREALFEALIVREWLLMLTDLRQRLADDPTSVLLSRMTRHIVSLAVNNFLMLMGDPESLGELRRSDAWQEVVQFRMETATTYLEQLRNSGLLLTDIDVQTQIKMMAAISSGFFVVNQILSPDYQFSPEEMVERLAQTFHRTFEPEQLPDQKVLEEVARSFHLILDQFTELLERKYNEATL